MESVRVKLSHGRVSTTSNVHIAKTIRALRNYTQFRRCTSRQTLHSPRKHQTDLFKSATSLPPLKSPQKNSLQHAMNGTPRLRSAFPDTPQAARRQNGAPTGGPRLAQPLPDIATLQPRLNHDGPLIPFETLDAPQQRLYVVAFYVALLAWRLYDHHYLQEEETESLWLFMKWVAFDGVFLFGLPELRIPWLEWSSGTMTILFLAHSILDGILMFRIPVRQLQLQSRVHLSSH